MLTEKERAELYRKATRRIAKRTKEARRKAAEALERGASSNEELLSAWAREALSERYRRRTPQ